MNVGSVVLGVSTALAIAAAVGAGFALRTPEPIQGPQIGVCGMPPESEAATRHSMAASFLIKNTSGSPVTIRGIRPDTLRGLSSATVTLAPGAAQRETTDYESGATIDVPASTVAKSSPIASDGSTTIAAHSFATVITSMTLADGARAGSAGDFELTSEGPFGSIHTQMIRATVGLGVDDLACSAVMSRFAGSAAAYRRSLMGID